MKQLEITIKSCCECPYCQYNGDYNRSHDSGYDCVHPEMKGRQRIVDDWDVSNSNNKHPKGWPEIPKECPLPDVLDTKIKK